MRYLILALSVLVLIACSETIMLSKPKGETVATGTLRFRLNPPHHLTVTLNGNIYEGDVDSKSIEMSDSDHLLMRFGAYYKHYDHQYKGTLKTPAGDTLTCEYLSSKGGGTLGVCEDPKGQTYEVHR